MGHSTTYNKNFSGVAIGLQYSGTLFDQFIVGSQPGEAYGGTLLTAQDTLVWQNGSPNPDPWGSIRSVIQSNYFDLTLNMKQYPYYDGSPTLNVALRATYDPINDSGASIAYTVEISAQSPLGFIHWLDIYGIRKSIAYAVPSSGIWRLVLEGHELSVYLNGAFIDSYDYSVGYTIPNQLGSWGLRNYAGFQQIINSFMLKTDRLDNI